jgi:hypothetical protein
MLRALLAVADAALVGSNHELRYLLQNERQFAKRPERAGKIVEAWRRL